jgi:hypothetical protein
MERMPAVHVAEAPSVSFARVLERPPWARRHPVVCDANALIEDVLRRARTDFTAMTFLAEHELAALVMPAPVEAEVREHLPAVAARTDCPAELAMHVWETVPRQLVRVVELPDAVEFPGDPRVAAVALRDGDDAPLAHLATLLAPCVVLTRDCHLTDEGFGQANWLTTVLLLKRLAELEALVFGGSRFVWLASTCRGSPSAASAGSCCGPRWHSRPSSESSSICRPNSAPPRLPHGRGWVRAWSG